ncbi:MAG: response regulator transcription factor [Chloroflexi bacterium]|nr:response regulator transcription factor [Chloroflexota bacterium]
MIEPQAFATSLPDEDSYREILTSIVQRYVRLVGTPAALTVARRVPGLILDEQGRVQAYAKADPLDTLNRLLDEYGAVFGDRTVSLPQQVTRTVAVVQQVRQPPIGLPPLHVLLVDDHVLFRSGLVRLLGVQPDITVVGEAGTRAEAITLARELQPDLILMDINLPDGNGVEATTAIMAELPATRIIFLTVHDDDEHLFAAIRAGGTGYMLKNIGAAELVSRVRGARYGEAALSPALAGRILDEFARLPAPQGSEARTKVDLTPREVDIVRLLARGASNRDIAQQFVISENTVKNHVQNVLAKLHLHSRRDVPGYARSHGLDLPPGRSGL